MKSNILDYSLLDDPNPKADLPTLARELNALAQIRNNARIAFCKRLATAYLLVVGHRPSQHSADGEKFRVWCDEQIRSAAGEKYSRRTIDMYVAIGFAKNPEAIIAGRTTYTNKRAQEMRRLGAAVSQAVAKDVKVLPMREVRKKLNVSADVAQEVNALMTAWEQASAQARSQFLYLVSGRKVA